MPEYAPVQEQIYNDFRSGLAHALCAAGERRGGLHAPSSGTGEATCGSISIASSMAS